MQEGIHTCRVATQRVSNAAQVDDDGLDAVTLALNLGLDTLHLVAVEGVGDVATDVNVGHDCGLRRRRFSGRACG